MNRERMRARLGYASLQCIILWFLAALLVTGAASYSHGSRYDIVPGHSPLDSVGAADVEPAPSFAAGPCIDPETLEKGCCERLPAPRSEPVPVRTGAVDPRSFAGGQPGDWMHPRIGPGEPDLPAPMLVKLSISRT
jgi:hypothetical protein